MQKEDNRYHYIIYPSEIVVFDSTGKRIVACPTVNEAEEYIRELERNRKDGSVGGG